MRRALFFVGVGFSAAFLLAFTLQTAPARHPTPSFTAGSDVTRAQIYVYDPYQGGGSVGVPNVTGKAITCADGVTALGLYDDGGSLAPVCLATGTATAVNAIPAAPSGVGATTSYQFAIDAGWPSMPSSIDSFMKLQAPTGLMAFFDKFSTTENWEVTCVWPEAWGQSTLLSYNERLPASQGTAGSVVWANTSLLTRSKVYTVLSTASVDIWAGLSSASGIQRAWRGNTAGAGGFLAWIRHEFVSTKANSRTFIGLISKTTGLIGNADPNTELDSVYFGCNSGDTNLSICSNDNSGNATCTTLGSSFPCTTSGAFYDVWFAAPPNGSVINYYIERLDSAAQASGQLSADLPRNTVQLNWRDLQNTGSTTSTQVTVGFMGECILANN